MSAPPPAPFVAVKLTPVGRAQSFLVSDQRADAAPRAGDRVVVQSDAGTAVGTVVRRVRDQAGKIIEFTLNTATNAISNVKLQ